MDNNGEEAMGEYTKDGSVDLQGNPILRLKSGGWKACRFIVVYELFERMAFYGIASNMVIYLSNELHQGIITASNNVTNWVGAMWLMPIFGAYIADAHLGRYWTFIFSSIIYFLGMCMTTLSVSIPSLKPPICDANENASTCDSKATYFQLIILFGSLYTIAIGTGGTKPNISTIGADQFDEVHPKEHTQKLSFFNWWMSSIFVGSLLASTILVYIQDNVGWSVGYILPTLGLAVSIGIFLIGTPFYRHKLPMGSPFTKMMQVIVAAMRKMKVSLPSDDKEFHELGQEYERNRKFRINRTSSLSFLNKASVKNGQSESPWSLCTVTQVEETKQMLHMIPIFIATFVPSIILAQVNTLFVKQGTTLNRQIGPNFRIPPASLVAFVTISMLISLVIYDRFLVPFVRSRTGNPRGFSLLQRLGIGYAVSTVAILAASFTERNRLIKALADGVAESGASVHMSIFVLLPQFVLVGVSEAFAEIAKMEFFYDQAPEGMKSLGTSYALTTLGVGSFMSSFFLKTTARVTARDGGRKGWILNNMNKSHLDYYYAFLAVLSALNFVFFVVVSRLYVYRAEFTDDEDQSKIIMIDNVAVS